MSALTGLFVTPVAAQAVPCAVTDAMTKASQNWLTNGPDLAANNWSNANYHVGNLALVRTTGISNHKTWPWVKANKFLLPLDAEHPFAPDAQSSGEAYLDVSYFHPEPEVLQPLRDNLRAQVASGKFYWKSPDALNMSLPSMTRIALADKDQAMLDYAHRSFRVLKARSFNEFTGLWSFHTQTNGWAVQGLAKAILWLPADSPARADYARSLKRTAATLKHFQRPDGFWNSSLIAGRGIESASTAMITYAIAAGINAGVLDSATYLPVVQKGWAALTGKALQADGKFGYVQARGSHKPSSAADTAGFAVGSYLIAGQQVAKLTPGC
ncbi:glycoside hydrolase family 88 protein [Lentzea sp. NBRC 105346]|uniref:glycoside hydrolase family 88 protein n=1 Tax=Lentzea sp. NBRC 105346 TaxID=3032205 RepID=UPI0025528ED3|nr:glycoside hydrolase family 88 protein [Lentzea sp. NBRC 105346]